MHIEGALYSIILTWEKTLGLMDKIGSITSRCSGKCARTHPPKELIPRKSLFGEDQRPDPGDGGNRAYGQDRVGDSKYIAVAEESYPFLIRDKKQHLSVQTIRRVEMYFCKIVANSKKSSAPAVTQQPQFNNLKWAKDKWRFVYHVHLTHHRGAKSWFQSRVTYQK